MFEHNFTLLLSEEKLSEFHDLMIQTDYENMNEFLNFCITIGIYNHIRDNANYLIECKKSNTDSNKWKELEYKRVTDSDGFLTDYTLYQKENRYVCIFGDKELYTPYNSEPDFTTENRSIAFEWFNLYEGFTDDI